MLTVAKNLDADKDKYQKSYSRLVSLQAWRSFLGTSISEGSLAFFLEAQNDALVSHVLARLGSWRAALKALRSCIENTVFCLFYMDHPVELQLWHRGAHKLGSGEMFKYLERHPQVALVSEPLTGLPILQEEYATLSRAVHGSSAGFRMTVDARSTLLWSDARSSLGKWSTREQKTVSNLNLLLLTIFAEKLQGSSFSALRQAVSLAVPTAKYAQIRRDLGVSLVRG